MQELFLYDAKVLVFNIQQVCEMDFGFKYVISVVL